MQSATLTRPRSLTLWFTFFTIHFAPTKSNVFTTTAKQTNAVTHHLKYSSGLFASLSTRVVDKSLIWLDHWSGHFWWPAHFSHQSYWAWPSLHSIRPCHRITRRRQTLTHRWQLCYIWMKTFGMWKVWSDSSRPSWSCSAVSFHICRSTSKSSQRRMLTVFLRLFVSCSSSPTHCESFSG